MVRRNVEIRTAAHRFIFRMETPELSISQHLFEDIKAQIERFRLAESKLEEFDVRWDGNQYSFDPSGTYKR